MDAFLELFSTKGRVNRAWFFWHILLDDLVIAGAGAALLWAPDVLAPIFKLPMAGVTLGAAWAAIAITVKRLHDMGRPGRHFLFMLIPIVNIIFGLQLLFTPGDEGDNEYGPDPLAIGSGALTTGSGG